MERYGELVDAAVEVTFELGRREFAALLRSAMFRRRANLLSLFLGLVYLGLGIVWASGLMLILAGALVGSFLLTLAIVPALRWRRLPSFHGEQHIVLDPGWIMRESSMGEVKEKWAQYRTVVETRTLYYFRANNRGVNCPIPKRAFAPGDEATFRSLAAAHLDTKFRDPSPS